MSDAGSQAIAGRLLGMRNALLSTCALFSPFFAEHAGNSRFIEDNPCYEKRFAAFVVSLLLLLSSRRVLPPRKLRRGLKRPRTDSIPVRGAPATALSSQLETRLQPIRHFSRSRCQRRSWASF
jgi:hypothetical protein